MNADDTGRFIAGQTFYRGTFAFSVPRGNYSVDSYISTVSGSSLSYTLAAAPEFLVDHDMTVTLDARDGTLFSAATPRPSSPVHAELNFQRVPHHGLQFTDSLTTFDDTPLYATPTSAVSVGRMYFYPAMRLGDAGASLDHYLYDVEFPYRGAIPADLEETVTPDSLATVSARYASAVPGLVEQESRIGALPWQALLVGSINNLTAPSTRTEYVTARPRLLWHQEVDLDPNNGNGRTLAKSAIYTAGQQLVSTWNDQPSGSGVEQEDQAGQACPACRSGDTLGLVMFPHVDGQNDIMLADGTTTEAMTLYQDGTVVGQSRGGFASFPLSPDPASYQLVYDVDTNAPWWPTSTHVSTTWGFESEERPPSQLPPGWTCGGKQKAADGCSFENLLLVHYHSSAGLDGVIPAGGPASVTVAVTPQRGVDPDPLTSLTAQVSYDGGTTWTDVTAHKRSSDTYRPQLHPAGSRRHRRLRIPADLGDRDQREHGGAEHHACLCADHSGRTGHAGILGRAGRAQQARGARLRQAGPGTADPVPDRDGSAGGVRCCPAARLLAERPAQGIQPARAPDLGRHGRHRDAVRQPERSNGHGDLPQAVRSAEVHRGVGLLHQGQPGRRCEPPSGSIP